MRMYNCTTIPPFAISFLVRPFMQNFHLMLTLTSYCNSTNDWISRGVLYFSWITCEMNQSDFSGTYIPHRCNDIKGETYPYNFSEKKIEISAGNLQRFSSIFFQEKSFRTWNLSEHRGENIKVNDCLKRH